MSAPSLRFVLTCAAGAFLVYALTVFAGVFAHACWITFMGGWDLVG